MGINCFRVRLIELLSLVIWGPMSVVGDLYEVRDIWQEKALNVTIFATPCGHAIPEEAPDQLISKLMTLKKNWLAAIAAPSLFRHHAIFPIE